MKPTYSTIEVLRMIPNLDEEGLKILSDVLMEEKYLYCLVDLRLMKKHFDERLRELHDDFLNSFLRYIKNM